MANKKESSHAANVTNFESLITSATAFGTSYNPSKDSILLPALQTLLTASKSALSVVHTAESVYSNAVDARELEFEPLGKLCTRVNNALKASDSSMKTDESAKTIFRKLQGKRATPKLTREEIASLKAEGNEVTKNSVSQMGYDSRLENFDKLIYLLLAVPQYKPNEEELKVDSLKALHTSLKTKNTEVVTAYVQLSNARIKRNEILYKPLTGLVDIAADSKMYIKSVFGASSPEYKQVSKLAFIAHNK